MGHILYLYWKSEKNFTRKSGGGCYHWNWSKFHPFGIITKKKRLRPLEAAISQSYSSVPFSVADAMANMFYMSPNHIGHVMGFKVSIYIYIYECKFKWTAQNTLGYLLCLCCMDFSSVEMGEYLVKFNANFGYACNLQYISRVFQLFLRCH